MMRAFSSDERKKFLDEIYRTYGSSIDVEGLVLLHSGKNKVRATTEQTYETAMRLKGVQLMGLYIAKRRKGFTTLTIEGCMFLSSVHGSAVVDLDREQAIAWVKGGPVKVEKSKGVILGRYKRFFLGSAVVDRLGNAFPQIPSWRRIPASTE